MASPTATYVAVPPAGGPQSMQPAPTAAYEQLLPNDNWKRVRFNDADVEQIGEGVIRGSYAMGGAPNAGLSDQLAGNGDGPGLAWSGSPGRRRRSDSRQMFFVGLCVAAVLMIILGAASLHLFGPPSALDCEADFGHAAVAWSETKKEFCCENLRIGCELLPEHGKHPNWHPEKPPTWLDAWLGELSLGVKFLITCSIFMLIGCCSGTCCYLQYLKASIAKERVQTESEVMRELARSLHLVGAQSGEISVTLMWDTKDDLDLHVKVPGGYGEISVENPECSGGRFDIDGNVCLATGTTKPLEHIYWPKCSRSSNTHPPLGEYEVWVKVFDKHDHCAEANIIVLVNVCGNKEVHHLRVLPGCTELRVATFHYAGPADQ
mmetsp:Transcript_126255/g.363167  ORF Transcript_126255/g.363167 Transcript_126255/m.363167 type:complete len:377 (+) Transcript_126255:66-1196(+)